MAEYTCKDINGNDINQFVFSDEGIVYGLVNFDGSQTTYDGTNIPYNGEGDLVNLSSECCNAMSFTFNNDNGKCYYQDVTQPDNEIKVVFNVDETNGVIFTKQEGEDCSLNLKFDYLIEYDSGKLFEKIESTNVIDLINGLNLSVVVEKYGFKEGNEGETFETNKTLIPIINQPFYDTITINKPTGIILSGLQKEIIKNKLKSELGVTYNSNILDSDWLTLDLLISDSNLINQIVNEEVKFSIQVNEDVCDFSIIMDNIELNKICTKTNKERRTFDKSPGFNLQKVVDNKKSWVNKSTSRKHDLLIRETDYNVGDERLIINSKEIELSTSVADAITQDVYNYIQDNEIILKGVPSNEGHTSIDLTKLLTTDYSTITTIEQFIDVVKSELINVKTRKSSIGYPTLYLVYERYLNSELYTGGESNKYGYSTVSKFIKLLGTHWVDLIEQVIPASTLWGSTNRITNSIFHNNKFTYKRYDLLFCNRDNEDNYVSTNNVDVIVTSVEDDEVFSDNCDNVYIKSMNDDCSTIGTVTIISNNQIN